MKIFPAIDIIGGKAVRLFKGDYDKMTVYADNPVSVAEDFKNAGAEFMHLVDLEGAKSGDTPNYERIKELIAVGLKTEVGGGIRNMSTVEKYLNAGAFRVILGTAAVKDKEFLKKAVSLYGDKIAVGVDIKDGFVAISGWTEKSDLTAKDFLSELFNIGVKTVICTDISKDGAMAGTNFGLYSELVKSCPIDFVASGGVSSIEDIVKLKDQGLYGAIIGKAYYTGAIDLKQAIGVAK